MTLGRAITSDFTRESRNDGWPPVDWLSWAHRLNTALSGLLDALDAPTIPTLDGGAVLSGPDLGTVIGALTDAAIWQSARGNGDVVTTYRSLARALGDDR